MNQNYFVYLTTNPNKTTLYTGMTNDLARRIQEHYNSRGNPRTFAGRYYCYCLLYYQRFDTPTEAIEAEKEIKSWKRWKKEELINEFNPEWKFLNDEL